MGVGLSFDVLTQGNKVDRIIGETFMKRLQIKFLKPTIYIFIAVLVPSESRGLTINQYRCTHAFEYIEWRKKNPPAPEVIKNSNHTMIINRDLGADIYEYHLDKGFLVRVPEDLSYVEAPRALNSNLSLGFKEISDEQIRWKMVVRRISKGLFVNYILTPKGLKQATEFKYGQGLYISDMPDKNDWSGSYLIGINYPDFRDKSSIELKINSFYSGLGNKWFKCHIQ